MPNKKCHKHTRHTISWRQEEEMTETHRQIRDIHIKQEQNKKAPTCCYFLTEGTGSDCQTIDAQLVWACAAPYVL